MLCISGYLDIFLPARYGLEIPGRTVNRCCLGPAAQAGGSAHTETDLARNNEVKCTSQKQA